KTTIDVGQVRNAIGFQADALESLEEYRASGFAKRRDATLIKNPPDLVRFRAVSAVILVQENGERVSDRRFLHRRFQHRNLPAREKKKRPVKSRAAGQGEWSLSLYARTCLVHPVW